MERAPFGGRCLYDAIGRGYGGVRRPDPRIERRLHEALDRAPGAHSTSIPRQPLLNVGAGAGSYEPADRLVVAVEPSVTMIRQRPPGSGPPVRSHADRLPFPAGAFHAAMALLTVHHWPDPWEGLAELRRVTRGPVIVLTFDKAVHEQQWLVTDYLPSMSELDADLPTPAEIADALGGGTVEVLTVPHDCLDGFCHAWWRRPEAYLDPAVRAAISGIARLPGDVVERAMAELAQDLVSGSWHRTHRDLLGKDEIDAGYRVVVSPERRPGR